MFHWWYNSLFLIIMTNIKSQHSIWYKTYIRPGGWLCPWPWLRGWLLLVDESVVVPVDWLDVSVFCVVVADWLDVLSVDWSEFSDSWNSIDSDWPFGDSREPVVVALASVVLALSVADSVLLPEACPGFC
jgi:hypothetical protein